MKEIVLILLFILTLQKSIHTDPPKDFPKDQHPYKRSSYRISPNQDCPPGYYKDCFVIGMYRGIKNLPKTCYCFEKKIHKINRILKEISSTKDQTTKDKDKPVKDRFPKDKYNPLRRELLSVVANSPKCNGDFLVCYYYPLQKVSRCHCTKFPHRLYGK